MPEHENRLAELSYRPMTPEAAEELRRWLAIQDVLNEVAQERLAQIAQWGDEHLPLGFGSPEYRDMADMYRRLCDEANEKGDVTYRHVLLEDVFEAVAESDPKKARDELLQVAAVAVKIIQGIDRAAAGG